MKKIYCLLFVCLLFGNISFALAQTTDRIVFFTDKNGTNFSTDRPEEFLSSKALERRQKQGISVTEQDLPVSESYLEQVGATGAIVRYPLKWFNGAIVRADESVFAQIETLPFVSQLQNLTFQSDKEKLERIAATASVEEVDETCEEEENYDYGNSLTQLSMLGIDKMHKSGYTGKGVHIAVLDGGFSQAQVSDAFANADIPYVFDVVGNSSDVYRGSSHGTKVLSIMASEVEGQMIGAAPDATYYLFRTEDTSLELPIEEAYWTVGAEKADSLGVDIIQSSLGYYDFDKSIYNYTHEDLDGKTAIISRSAEIASEKGIVVITSAGNTGSRPWQKIGFPADAPSVLAVGSVDASQNRSAFSAKGNSADGRVKPDVMAMGQATVLWNDLNSVSSGNGTSYAAPIIAGLAAGLMQSQPNLGREQVVKAIRESGDRFQNPDSDYGYGLPHVDRMGFPLISGEDDIEPVSFVNIFPNPFSRQVRFRLDESVLTQKVKLFVYDVQGKLILNKNLTSDEAIIALPSVSAGLYLFRFEAGKRSQTVRVIKR